MVFSDNIVDKGDDIMASLTNSMNVQGDAKSDAENPTPSKEMIHALQEAQDIIDGKVESKGYHDVHQMFEDILHEECMKN